MPAGIQPMLAKLVEHVPRGDWSFEVKWDGIRAMVYLDGGTLRVESRRGNDLTSQFPELAEFPAQSGVIRAVLDGEIIALDDRGRPSFERLQQRLGLLGSRAQARAAEVPVSYVIFDLLYFGRHSLLDLPYRERRRLLEDLALAGPAWSTPGRLAGDGDTVLAATRTQGLEGVIAKRNDSLYEPGRRSGAWVKIKNRGHQRFVIGGWVPRENAATPTVGALLLGYQADPAGEERGLTYAGRVGTGFTDDLASSLAVTLQNIATESSPFAHTPALPAGVLFVEPELVADVQFLEWTADGLLRQPSFKGLRPDVDPRDVRRE